MLATAVIAERPPVILNIAIVRLYPATTHWMPDSPH
jgi:hypothetical protein